MTTYKLSHFELSSCAQELQFHENKKRAKNEFTRGALRFVHKGVNKKLPVDFMNTIQSQKKIEKYLTIRNPEDNEMTPQILEPLKEKYLYPHLQDIVIRNQHTLIDPLITNFTPNRTNLDTQGTKKKRKRSFSMNNTVATTFQKRKKRKTT